ncbi:MAG: 6-phospho-beta-glucosidase [Chloroflexota bacterium]
MKLTLIGGGGVRGPLFVASCLARAERLGLDEISLLDNRQDRLDLIAPIAQEIVRRSGGRVSLVATTDPEVAIRDASHVVTTIRVGGDEARIGDERVALARGVLGQETTGPGGFAMAMRTIPVALRYAEQIARLAPAAWTYNFSNPAGLVTQALRDAGHERVIGICDGANAAQMRVAEFLGLDPDDLRAEVFGLNHLSWSRSVTRDGVELLKPLLADPEFRAATSLGLFDAELVETKGLWMNEYLFSYYYAEAAIQAIARAPETRGEEVCRLNAELLGRLALVESQQDAVDEYYAYQRRRISTYMPFERPAADVPHGPTEETARARSRIDEGYAGVALTAIEALATGRPTRTALNVPNAGAIDGMGETDVVEVSCSITAAGIEPAKIDPLPGPELALMIAVKTYERLSVQAIASKSRRLAVEALMSHPLVLTYPLARDLVDDYISANRDFVGRWGD